MKKIGGFIMKLSLATTGLATMCCLTTACGKEADLTPIDTSAVPNATSSIVTTAPITTTTPIITSTQQMSVDIPLTDEVIIDTTIDDDIVIVTDENVSRDTLTTTPKVTTTKKPETVTTTTTKKTTTTTTTKKVTTTTTTAKKTTTTKLTTTQEITTTTSPTIKITQEDVDRLVDELQEYSNEVAYNSLYEQTATSKRYSGKTEEEITARVNEIIAERVAEQTPSNSSWDSPNIFYLDSGLWDYSSIYNRMIDALNWQYESSPNSHIVIYVEYHPNGYVYNGTLYNTPDECYVFYCLR